MVAGDAMGMERVASGQHEATIRRPIGPGSLSGSILFAWLAGRQLHFILAISAPIAGEDGLDVR